MNGTAMAIGVEEGRDATLQGIINRLFQCSHRHKSRPITPRGEDQCYAVCLDCGKRLPQDRPLMRIEPPVERSSASPAAPEQRRDTPETAGCTPHVYERLETVGNASSPAYGWQAWKLDLLWVGLFVIGLAVGSLLPIKGPGHKNLLAPKAAQPSVSAEIAVPQTLDASHSLKGTIGCNASPHLNGNDSVAMLKRQASPVLALSGSPGYFPTAPAIIKADIE